ncbi:trypsin-like peptidase [Bradymonas sediminis]|nr:trypsin-like peptidase [Bradymonas sediminis]
MRFASTFKPQHPRLSGLILAIFCALATLALGASPTFAQQGNPAILAEIEDPLAAAEAYQQQLFTRVAPSVIFIAQGGSFGSGFFINDTGLALTNKHVVGKAKSVTVVFQDGRKRQAKVVEVAGDAVDLALIQVDIKSSPALELSGFNDLRVGSWVGSVGHGSGGIWSFATGMVSNIYVSKEDRSLFQTQIPLNPGASGGPVFDRKGRVAGVVTSGILNTNSVNFAIRIDVAFDSLEKLSKDCDCLTIRAPKGVPIFVNGRAIGKGPRLRITPTAGSLEVFVVIGGKMQKKTISYPKTREITFK